MILTKEIISSLIREEIEKQMSASEVDKKVNALYSQISSLSKNDAVKVANSLRAEVAKMTEPEDTDPEEIDEACGDMHMQSIDMGVDHHNKEKDHEGDMAKRQMYKTAEYAAEIFDMLEDDDHMPAWIQSKITKIADYIGVVKHYLEYDHIMGEKLDKDATAGDYVKDFRKSKAPQFKGKSKKKKQEMAIAAYLDAQEDK